jgi:hypothetical protein
VPGKPAIGHLLARAFGGSGGSGTLYFRGRAYPLSTGGLDYGPVFGGSKGEQY